MAWCIVSASLFEPDNNVQNCAFGASLRVVTMLRCLSADGLRESWQFFAEIAGIVQQVEAKV